MYISTTNYHFLHMLRSCLRFSWLLLVTSVIASCGIHIQKRSHFKGYTVHFNRKQEPVPAVASAEPLTAGRTRTAVQPLTDEVSEAPASPAMDSIAVTQSTPEDSVVSPQASRKSPAGIWREKVPAAFIPYLEKQRARSADPEVQTVENPNERIMHPALAVLLALILLILLCILLVALGSLMLSGSSLGALLLFPLVCFLLIGHWLFLTLLMFSRKKTKFSSIRKRNGHYILIAALVSLAPFFLIMLVVLFLLTLSWPE